MKKIGSAVMDFYCFIIIIIIIIIIITALTIVLT